MSDSESDIVTLSLPASGLKISKWVEYRANSNFLTPTDGFEFTLAVDSISDQAREGLRAGARVTIDVNDHVQADGYIDRVTTSASRGGGTVMRVEGCDRLAQVVRAGIDPRVRFTEGQTLLDLLETVFAPFGYTTDNMLVSNETNRNIRSGQTQGGKTSISHSKKKGTTVKPLKSFVIHQLKPYHGERAFAFASRITQRFGLWIWLSAEGNVLIVGNPTFDQPPRYTLHNKRNGSGTRGIISGVAHEDSSDQPSCIVATGFSYGGETDRSNHKVIVVNEIVAMAADGFATDAVSKIISANEDASQLPLRTVFPSTALRPHPAAQPIYPHDQESQTLEQLQGFARRELALKQQHSLHVTYHVEGHTTNSDVIWCTDCIVDVDDDFLGIHEPMWILSRTFEKSRHAGTTTTLELIRPYTLAFSSQ